MGRTRKGMVQETHEELQALLARHSASPFEPRVRLLMAIKEDPRIKSEALMGLLGLSDRTIRRWWSEYHKSGVASFLDLPQRTSVAVAEEPDNYGERDPGSLMAFLNSLPLTSDVKTWRVNVESSLLTYLPGLEAVEVEIDALHDWSDGSDPRTSRAEHDQPRRVIFEIGHNAVLGRLKLLFGQTTSEEHALELLEELRPFLAFLFSDAVARVTAVGPRRNVSFDEIVTGPLLTALTPRERDVLVHRLYGYSYSDSAERLGVSEESIRKCVKSIYRKTNTASMGELFVKYFSSLDSTDQ